MIKKISIPRGTNDILPSEISQWQDIESKARQILENFNYKEIRTPIFEESALFKRSLGQTSDVVNKQLLELSGDKKEGFALRPEATASIVRSYIENSLNRKEQMSKLYYIGPMFRGERPQKGRLRQFNQIGVEAIGPASKSPYLDAEIIILSVNLLKALGLSDFKLKINSLGSLEDKEKFSKLLRTELKSDLKKLSKNDQDRYKRNVFRILDSKDQESQGVVNELTLNYSHLSEESLHYYTQVKEALEESGINYVEDPKLVRGLDYYTDTVFEIIDDSLGSQDALGAGGRYDDLVEQLGGPKVDAVGFALGVERILLLKDKIEADRTLTCYIVALDKNCLSRAFQLLNEIRQEGISSDMSFKIGSMKSQMRLADKSNARYVLIVGEDELKNNQVTVKDMKTGEQETVDSSKVKDFIKC